MAEHILFLTGKRAARSLARVPDPLEAPGFTWAIHNIGVGVAALMTRVPGVPRGKQQAFWVIRDNGR